MTTTTEQVTISDRAATRISAIVASDPENQILRVSVSGGGCSGFQYGFNLVSNPNGDDIVIENAGAKVVIDPVSFMYMAGSVIDYEDSLLGSAFRIHNPMAVAGCGCGTSFAI